MKQIYELHAISQNLRKEETIVQIAEELQHLTEVSNDIFKRIQLRINKNKEHLANLTNRINVVGLKLDKLDGRTKATQVFSSCKYPAADSNKNYESIFNDVDVPFNKYEHNYSNNRVKDEPLTNLQLYHVKVKDKLKSQKILPRDADCVNDLLLFNTGLSSNEQSQALPAIESVSDIGIAPHSISEGNITTRNVKDSYSYLPDLGNVPAINVPIDLPDLPGIAGDVRYTIEDQPGIAPSGDLTTVLFPVIEKVEDVITIKEEIKASNLPVEVKSEPIPVVAKPEPIIVKQESVPKVENIPIEVEVTPKVVPDSKVIGNLKEIKVKTNNDARANLMESIREAGGKKTLKPANKKPEEKKATSGDLMADLHAKLSLRRKGISGDKKLEIDAQSTLDKISALIPPPPLNNAQNSSSDEEWDD